MIGLVLSGGKSLRMGADKGLLLKDDKTWVEIAREKLSLLVDQVIISVNADQYIKYCDLLDEKILLKDDDHLSVKGPLLGILSCLTKYPQQDIFVLACDLVLMESELMDMLRNSCKQYPDYEAYVFKNQDDLEPLCGIYSSRGLFIISEFYRRNSNSKNSMKYLLSQLNVCQIPLPKNKEKYFTNFNGPAELSIL